MRPVAGDAADDSGEPANWPWAIADQPRQFVSVAAMTVCEIVVREMISFRRRVGEDSQSQR